MSRAKCKQTQPNFLINLEGERITFLGQLRKSPGAAGSSHVRGTADLLGQGVKINQEAKSWGRCLPVPGTATASHISCRLLTLSHPLTVSVAAGSLSLRSRSPSWMLFYQGVKRKKWALSLLITSAARSQNC